MGRFAAGLEAAEQRLVNRLGRAAAVETCVEMKAVEAAGEQSSIGAQDESRWEKHQALFGHALASHERLEAQRLRIAELLNKLGEV